MNKYIEELNPGDCFLVEDCIFVLTIDFKKDSRMSINLGNGNPRWIRNNVSVIKTEIYTLDQNNNISPINPQESNVNPENNNLS